MIDHFTLTITSMTTSRSFYEKALAPLGYGPKMDYMNFVGFGDARKPYLWLKEAAPVTTPQHIAFVAGSREAVDAFHKAALEAGARDDGPPGIREDYHPHYYAAFVIDPHDGHHLEAVTHADPAAKATAPAAAAKKKAAARKAAPKKAAKKKKSKR